MKYIEKFEKNRSMLKRVSDGNPGFYKCYCPVCI